jgi:hypothetical protein
MGSGKATICMHEIKQVNVKWVLPEVFTDQLEDCAF